MGDIDIGTENILSKAIKAVPAVRYALGLAGIAAAVAIILGFIKDIKIAFFGLTITIALMIVLVVFSNIVQDLPGKRWMGAWLSWVVILLFSAVLIVIFTSLVFGFPERLASFFVVSKAASESATSKPTDAPPTDTPTPLEPLPLDVISKLKPVQEPIPLSNEKGKIAWTIHNNDSTWSVKELILNVTIQGGDGYQTIDERRFQLYLSPESSGEPYKISKYIGECVIPPKYEKNRKYYSISSAKGLKK